MCGRDGCRKQRPCKESLGETMLMPFHHVFRKLRMSRRLVLLSSRYLQNMTEAIKIVMVLRV
jgi:hypothetical protein